MTEAKKSKRLLVMAGGTGGHVFPGLAVAKKLREEGWEIRWLGTADRMEADLVPQHGIDIDFIEVKGVVGQGLMRKLTAPLTVAKAVMQARRYISAWKPDAVLGMGGYVSGPGGVAAWINNIPVVLHEQNAVAGLTNRMLAKIASRVMQAFPGAFKDAPVVGNPVREDVVALAEPQVRMAERVGPVRILIMGGSQGARVLNHTVPEAAALFGEKAEIWHQAGKGNEADTQARYKAAGVDARVTEFIKDVSEAYAWADLIICRSGALTVSELSAAGLAAIFVPFMHKDRQQALNADHLVVNGAAMMIEQQDLTAASLAEQVNSLDRNALLMMAMKARQQAITDADERVADAIKAVAN